MSADFWAGYLSGAVGIIIGNPLDLIKTRIQAGPAPSPSLPQAPNVPATTHFERWSALLRGAAAPILGYGALNALLFVTYNRSLNLLNSGNLSTPSPSPSQSSIFAAGALGGLATFVVSAPTELVKCRAQVSSPPKSSWKVAAETWRAEGCRGLYLGGGITSVRDAVGYGFYFWSYEMSKRYVQGSAKETGGTQEAVNVLLCGGLAGVVTWVSIFPLDVVKTRVQTHGLMSALPAAAHVESQPLLPEQAAAEARSQQARPSTLQIARQAYQSEGLSVFFRGIGICSARAFVVNAVQWAVYEWTMKILAPTATS